MSEAADEYWPHPLMPWLTATAFLNAAPTVPYAPMAEFRRQLDDACIVDPAAKGHILATYHHSMALAFVIAAGGGSDLHGDELHALIYRAADTNPFAQALCDAAADAFTFKSGKFFPSFRVASRLDGFGEAWQAWAKHWRYHEPFHGAVQLEYVITEMDQRNHPEADFWLDMAKRDYPSRRAFIQASAQKMELAEKAEQKRIEREEKRRKDGKTKRPPARFKYDIARYWLPFSLWARTHTEIALLLDPKGKAGVDRVKKDIGDLGFRDSHRWKLQKFIDRAEEAQKKSSNS